ncbi:MAG: DNA mismatch repair protein MutS [Chloroflexi bacterium]|nr:DNA mismatch repair protein MutS [Chloroflexota bacterium]
MQGVEEQTLTPVRQQYLRVKQNYPGTIVLFRLGDFYETFEDDARVVARELNIVLTSRSMGKGQRLPMAGIPYHALDNYTGRLLSKGYKLAVCEQLTAPTGKGIVPRDVVRVITPGTVVETALLDGKTNNYLAALVVEGGKAGIAYVDITTGEFAATETGGAEFPAELVRLRPAELLLPEDLDYSDFRGPVTRLDKAVFDLEAARKTLLDHFQAASLEGYGCDHLPLAVKAAAAILVYLEKNQKAALGQVTRLSTYSTGSFMVLDAQTRRNLGLLGDKSEPGGVSLLSVLDLTKTPMGARLLKRWLGQPLLDLPELQRRQDAVDWFFRNNLIRQKTLALLGKVADVERTVARVKLYATLPRELVSLRQSLELLEEIKGVLEKDGGDAALGWLLSSLKPCPDVGALISRSIAEEQEGVRIKPGFSPELDSLVSSSKDARQYVANLERQEKERTGIKSLKVGYNKVFGYYIEVSKPHLSQVPPDYIRKQTLLDRERFFTPELKEQESVILNAQERISEMEGAIFRQVCQQIGLECERILSSAQALAQIDVFAALAEAAGRYNYTRPVLNDGDGIIVRGGRHPVVERVLEGESFIPNDTALDCQENQLIVLTGPNMSGKSTYIRQVGLIALMAQTGSFVPAESATIGLVDRIFTRVGLRDDLAAGQSTFMVEMVETANILNNATRRSLIILDEIGRGTSTYDGISIARAVAEYIHNHPRLGSRTLFATHYHELVELAAVLPRVKNFNVAVKEEGGGVVFLRKIAPGGADKSYGIHVAQLAGLPRAVTNRAREVLSQLETSRPKESSTARGKKTPPPAPAGQLSLFADRHAVVEELSKLDISSLTPLEAITKLFELQNKARGA